MPKMKTNRSAAKRFEFTGTGKIRRRKAFQIHFMEHKVPSRLRRLARGAMVEKTDEGRIKRLLGK